MRQRSVSRPLLFVALVSVIFMLCHLLWRWCLPGYRRGDPQPAGEGDPCLFALALTCAARLVARGGLAVAPRARSWLPFLPPWPSSRR
ncbi:MAG: hypothetical protein IPM94_10815 [bacterium]|nr:hypothetical protein [bacterium]